MSCNSFCSCGKTSVYKNRGGADAFRSSRRTRGFASARRNTGKDHHPPERLRRDHAVAFSCSTRRAVPNPFALRSPILSAPCRGCIGTAAGAPANGHLLQMCDLFVHLLEFALRGHLHKIVASSARDSLVIRFSELAKSSNFLSSQASSKRKSIHMITRRIAIFAALSVAFYPVLPASPASDPDLLAGLDTDNDGTVSVDEAKKAA